MSLLMAEKSEGAPPMSASPFAGWPPSHSWTLDDLDRFPDDGRRYEIVDGSLYVSPSPSVTHQFRVTWLVEALLENMPDGCFTLAGPVDVLLQAEPTRVLVPDVVTGCGVDVEAELRYLDPADLRLVVEVVSPGSTTHDRFTKPVLYADAGIPTYWRVERGAAGPSVHVHHLTGPTEGGGKAVYSKACVINPGETITLDRPWPVTLTPPRRTSR
jgi:Uma2 family endonuclease